MTRIFILFSIAILFSLSFSCKEKEIIVETAKTLKLTVHPKYGSEYLSLDSVYTTQEGYEVQFTDVKFYFENIRNGATQLVDAALFDYKERGTAFLNVEGDVANFYSLQANLGVDSAVNHQDPSVFPTNSMLNIVNANDMHWGWNPGYIFVKIEAKVDTIPDATLNLSHNVVFHVGLDQNMETIAFPSVNWVPNGPQHFSPIYVDMKLFLEQPNAINLKNEYSTHSGAGEELLTTKVIANFKNALTIH